jgi:hypothetical protein
LLAFDGLTSCPAGGPHVSIGSGNYVLDADNPSAQGQSDWKWCTKCYCISFSANPSDGTCPRGGTHKHTGSSNYTILTNAGSGSGQSQWSWCNHCQALWFSGHASGRCCFSPLGAHSKAGSGDYTLNFSSD